VSDVFRSSTATLRRWALAVALIFFIPGCVSSRAFVPAEHVTAFSPEGDNYAAEYSLVEDGRGLGDVKVWSDGASRDASDKDPQTIVRVSFEIENQAASPLRFDSRRLFIEELAKPGATPGRTRALHVEGELVVPAGERREIEASFALPSSVWPSDVPGYRVGWSVVGERRHTRTTPFLRAVEPGYADPWYSYYSPYYGYYPYGYYPGFYGSWSLGFRAWPAATPYRGARVYRYYSAPRRR
jgi:hypothetical protein